MLFAPSPAKIFPCATPPQRPPPGSFSDARLPLGLSEGRPHPDLRGPQRPAAHGPSPVTPAPQPEAATATEQPQITWTLPPGWKALPGSGMRYATVQVPNDPTPLELSVIVLGPEALLPNVIRWEGQIGLPPSTESDLPQLITHIDLPQAGADLLDLTGTEHRRMLAAFISHDNRTWSFKLTGSDQALDSHKADFQTFIASVRFSGASSPSVQAATPATRRPPPVSWTAPPIGNRNPPSRCHHLLHHRLRRPTCRGHRHPLRRQQRRLHHRQHQPLGATKWDSRLPPPAPMSPPSSKTSANGPSSTSISPAPTPPPRSRRIHVALTAGSSNDLWFFKIRGNPATVEQQTAAFNGFLQSFHFGDTSGD